MKSSALTDVNYSVWVSFSACCASDAFGAHLARLTKLLPLLGALLAGITPGIAASQSTSETLYDVYRISSEASLEVDNELMRAVLVVQEEDRDSAALANRVNASMSWAVNKLRPYSTISVKTRDYQTYPRYDGTSARRLIGWRASQSVELETDDFTAAGKAIQELQEKLQVQNIELSVKPDTRKKVSDQLIENALDAFKERARLVQRNMGSTSFRVLEVDVRTQDNALERFNSRMMSDDMDYSSIVETAPAIVGGSSTVSVQISGRIQLD